MKNRNWVALLLLLSFGAFAQTNTPPADSKPAEEAKPAEQKPEAKPVEAAPATTSLEIAKPIAMIDYAAWEDESKIADNVVKECGSLGKQFADATEKAGRSSGLTFNKSPSADPRKAEQGVVITMVSAISSRSGIAGHNKQVTARVELYLNGKMVRTTTLTRDSGGGAFGMYKGSCSVLERTVTTLGSDVVKWLKQDTR